MKTTLVTLALVSFTGCGTGMAALHVTPCGLQYMGATGDFDAGIDPAFLDEGEKLWLEVFVDSWTVTDPRFTDRRQVCSVFSQYQLWVEPAAWYELGIGKVAGLTACWKRTIRITPPGPGRTLGALPHELAHAVQNCVSLEPSDEGVLSHYPNHKNWTRDHILDAVSEYHRRLQ